MFFVDVSDGKEMSECYICFCQKVLICEKECKFVKQLK